MGWIVHTGTHKCRPPIGERARMPEGKTVGSLWRCTEGNCGQLWRITGGSIWWFWQEATRREIRKYKDQGWD